MEKKKYPTSEEENTGTANEPTTGYAATGSGYVNTLMDEDCIDDLIASIPVGKLGFYTNDPEILETRIAGIEADLDEVEGGYEDPAKWVTCEQMDIDLRKQFPWLKNQIKPVFASIKPIVSKY